MTREDGSAKSQLRKPIGKANVTALAVAFMGWQMTLVHFIAARKQHASSTRCP
jgi:hypothetical protein